MIQNNKYGISVPVSEQSANSRIADNFRGFDNLLITYCDGTDVLDSYRAMQEAYEWCLSGRGAAMVHADCVRIGSHSNSDRQDLYRSPEELEAVKLRDPLLLFHKWLVLNEVATDQELEQIHEENQQYFQDAAAKAEAAPPANPADVLDYVLPWDQIESSRSCTIRP